MRSKWKIAKVFSIVLIVMLIMSQVAMSFAGTTSLENMAQQTAATDVTTDEGTASGESSDSQAAQGNTEATQQETAQPSATAKTGETATATETVAIDDSAEEADVAMPAQTLTASASDGAEITVSAPEGALPEGATVKASVVKAEKVKDAIEAVDETADEIAAYDITILDKDGNEIQPDKSVKVAIKNSGIKGDATVYHMENTSASAEKVADVSNGNNAKFQADGFSIYVVVNGSTTGSNLAGSTIEMKAGETETVKASYLSYSVESWKSSDTSIVKVKKGKNGQATLTAQNKAGSATITVTYEGNWSERQETFTVNVAEKSASITLTPTLTNVSAAYVTFHDATDAANATLTPITAATTVEDYVTASKTGYAVVFVKADDNYLLTGLGAAGNNDLYAIDGPYGNIANYPGIASLAAKAKAQGYTACFGWSRAAGTETDTNAEFTVVGQQPQISVAATSNKTEGVQAGEEVTFTVTITPGTITGRNVTVEEVSVTSLTINGVKYPITVEKQNNGTYKGTIAYTATEADCERGIVELDVTANVTYSYTLALANSGQAVTTTSTISSSDSTECSIARVLTIKANSASKTYDGTALTDSGYTYTDDILESRDTLTVVVEGSQTDAGSSANTVTSYKITRSFLLFSWDVTSEYAINTVNGTLTVDPREVTLTSATDSKTYDGTALTNDEVTVGGDGFVKGQGAAYNVTGSQLDVGSSANAFTYTLNNGTKAGNYTITKTEGTLTVNPIATEITITADSNNKTYDGTALTDNGFTYTENVLAKGDVLTAVVEGSQTNAGSSANVVKSYKVMRGDTDVTANYTFGDSVNGTLTVDQRAVTLTSATDSKTYDGTALTNDTVTVGGAGFAADEGATFNVTGSQLDVGSSINAFTYTLNDGTNADNYTITMVEGTLTVNPITATSIIITANSDSKTYDGTPLTNSGFSYTENVLVEGDVLTAVIEGSQTNAGNSANVVKSYKVMRGDTDVTNNYTFGDSVNGTLTVNKRAVTLTSATDSKAYDGTPLTNNNITVGGDGFATGEGATYDVTGSQTNAGSSKNTFDYTLNSNTNADNYNITKTEGTLTVTKVAGTIVITANSANKTYDGTPLTENGYTYTTGILKDGDVLTAVVEGSQTNAGSSANTVTSYKVMRGDTDVTNNYTFDETVNGTLTVSKKAVTLTSASDSKTYDGTALTNDTVTVGGAGFAAGEGATYDVTGSQTNAGSSKNTFGYTLNEGTNADNYTITKTEGTLTVSKKAVTLTSADLSKVYDGTALVNGDTALATEEGWAEGEGATYEFTGSQLDVGNSDNAFTYTLNNNTKADNYEITKTEGTLTVTPIVATTIVVKADSNSKTYDGAALTDEGFTYDGTLIEGDRIEAVITGSQTDAGSSNNVVTSFQIVRGEGADKVNVTGNYTTGTSVNGTLTVNARPVTLTSADLSKTYDGTELVNGSTALATERGWVEGEGATYTFTGSQTNAGSSANAFTYTLNEGTKAGNYTITKEEGTLTVNARAVTLTSATDSKTYDGTPLTNTTITVGGDGFATGEGATYDVTGSQTNAGSSDNTFTYTLNDNTKKDNYTITTAVGKLTVDPIDEEVVVTIVGNKGTAQYDGNSHEETGYRVTDSSNSLYAESNIRFNGEATASRTDVGTTDMGLTAADFANTSENFTNVTFKVTDGSMTITPKAVTITVENASKTYGDEDPEFNGIVNGLVDPEDLGTITYHRAEADASKENVGDEITIEASYTANDNYEVTVTPAQLTIIPSGTMDVMATSVTKVYDGQSLSTTATANVVDGTTIQYQAEGSSEWTDTPPTITNAGSITVKVKATNPNYEEKTTEYTLTVTPAPVTVSADNKTKTAGNDDPQLTATVSGLVNNEPISNITYSLSRATGEAAGSYLITPSGEATQGNYAVTYVPGTLTITAAPTPTPTPPVGPTVTPRTPAGGGTTPVAGIGGGITATINDGASPLATIDDDATPKAAVDNHWALLNLLLTIFTAALAVILIVLYFTKKRREEEEEDQQQAGAAAQSDEDDRTIKRRGVPRILSGIWAIAMIIVFFLTEDMSLPMQFTDNWTWLMVIMAIMQVVIAVVCKKQYDENDEEMNEA